MTLGGNLGPNLHTGLFGSYRSSQALYQTRRALAGIQRPHGPDLLRKIPEKFTIHRLPSLSGMNYKVLPVKSLERPHLHEIFELLDPDLPLDRLVFG